jgi:hypothetical protein
MKMTGTETAKVLAGMKMKTVTTEAVKMIMKTTTIAKEDTAARAEILEVPVITGIATWAPTVTTRVAAAMVVK